MAIGWLVTPLALFGIVRLASTVLLGKVETIMKNAVIVTLCFVVLVLWVNQSNVLKRLERLEGSQRLERLEGNAPRLPDMVTPY